MKRNRNNTNALESLARIILPADILDVFEVTAVREEHTGQMQEHGLELVIIHISLEERDLREHEWHDLKPNGFTEWNSINDFPIRDHKVILHIRRRRWLDEENRSIILPYDGICDNLTAAGTRYSKEFADVLKKIFGYIPDTGPLSGALPQD